MIFKYVPHLVYGMSTQLSVMSGQSLAWSDTMSDQSKNYNTLCHSNQPAWQPNGIKPTAQQCLTISLLLSLIQCIRGARFSCGHMTKFQTPPMDLAISELDLSKVWHTLVMCTFQSHYFTHLRYYEGAGLEVANWLI